MATDKSAKERFYQYCVVGDLKGIKTDLFYNVSPFTSLDKYGNNALHLTCMNNQPKVLEYILKTVKTCKYDVQNKLGRTALNIAASQGAFECIDILLNNLCCDINSTDENFKNTPLHWCVTSKCIKGVKQLLNKGADFQLVNKLGKTPMQLAKTSCFEIFDIIDKFIKNKDKCSHTIPQIEFGKKNGQCSRTVPQIKYVKNKDQCLNTVPQINNDVQEKINPPVELSSNSSQFKIADDSKLNSKINSQPNINNKTNTEPDLNSNNSNESFFLDISKLKHGDNSVLKLLEKSIEPIDETSFVSSILNSGKVIQLTEAGILALEYTKNEINTPIPNHLVKSFLTESQQYNDNENHLDDNTSKKDNEMDSKSRTRGLKRFKSPQPCSKRFKYSETTNNKNSEFESLLEQLTQTSKCTKTLPKVYNSNSYNLQSSFGENSTAKNFEACNKNQLVCLNSDISAQLKWVEDLISLFRKLDSDNMEQKLIDPDL